MPPRHQTLPSAQTASARAARQSFYCDLCTKGYSRMNDYEAHLSSYDHTHRQRMKDMKQMVKDPTASSRARKAEAKVDGLISIKLGDASNTAAGAGGAAGGAGATTASKKGGFKKSGFKTAFTPLGGADDATNETEALPSVKVTVELPLPGDGDGDGDGDEAGDESDTADEGYELYDPRKPTAD